MDDHCLICNAHWQTESWQAQGHSFNRCPQCSFVHLDMSRNAFEQLDLYQESYFQHAKYDDAAILRMENQRRLRLLRRFVPNLGARVLDAGCGIGDFLLSASEIYSDLHGFDISEHAIATAREKNPALAENLWAGEVDQTEIGNRTFEAICLWDVVEHVWNPLESVQRLAQWIEPGGYLLISTPNIGASFAGLLGQWWPFMTPPEHVSFLTKESFRHMAEDKLGLEMALWMTRGKWTNLGFIIYKINRLVKWRWLGMLVSFLQKSFIGRIPIYVPTGDIQYVVLRKPEASMN